MAADYVIHKHEPVNTVGVAGARHGSTFAFARHTLSKLEVYSDLKQEADFHKSLHLR